MKAKCIYNQRTFRETSKRRLEEARHLMEKKEKHKHYDGVATYALLSVECALKAALLAGHGVDSTEGLGKDICKKAFSGKSGHNLQVLRSCQASHMGQAMKAISNELDELQQKDPYCYRYGATPIQKEHAEKLVGYADKVVRKAAELCEN